MIQTPSRSQIYFNFRAFEIHFILEMDAFMECGLIKLIKISWLIIFRLKLKCSSIRKRSYRPNSMCSRGIDGEWEKRNPINFVYLKLSNQLFEFDSYVAMGALKNRVGFFPHHFISLFFFVYLRKYVMKLPLLMKSLSMFCKHVIRGKTTRKLSVSPLGAKYSKLKWKNP